MKGKRNDHVDGNALSGFNGFVISMLLTPVGFVSKEKLMKL